MLAHPGTQPHQGGEEGPLNAACRQSQHATELLQLALISKATTPAVVVETCVHSQTASVTGDLKTTKQFCILEGGAGREIRAVSPCQGIKQPCSCTCGRFHLSLSSLRCGCSSLLMGSRDPHYPGSSHAGAPSGNPGAAGKHWIQSLPS